MAARAEEDIFNRRLPDEEAVMLSKEEDEYDNLLGACEAANMVTFDRWEGTIRELFRERPDEASTAFEALKEVSKITCFILRKRAGLTRYQYHCQMAADVSLSDDDQSWHLKEAMACKEKPYLPRCGTGIIVYGDEERVFVMTNNHVIMESDEIEDAEVHFDFTDDDDDLEEPFQISRVFLSALRTAHDKDMTQLDFTILVLERGPSLEYGRFHMHTQEHSDPDMHDIEHEKVIMISHPHGLAQRLSCGTVAERHTHPVRHIRHDLGSLPGSSGGVLLYYFRGSWVGGFVHYRAQRAVALKAVFLSSLGAVAFVRHQTHKKVIETGEILLETLQECINEVTEQVNKLSEVMHDLTAKATEEQNEIKKAIEEYNPGTLMEDLANFAKIIIPTLECAAKVNAAVEALNKTMDGFTAKVDKNIEELSRITKKLNYSTDEVSEEVEKICTKVEG